MRTAPLAALCSVFLLLVLPGFADNCAGSGATVRQLLLYNLKSTKQEDVTAVTALFHRRLSECEDLLYPGSSYGGPAISTSPKVYGFPASKPMPMTATIADWMGWLDFTSLDGVRKCLARNHRSGSLAAMRAYAQPNGRHDLIIEKNTEPGSAKHGPCPFPDSYAPATVRYIFAYILPAGVNRNATCKRGGTLWRQILADVDIDVRHGTGCTLLTDTEARKYGIMFNSGFGGYVDFASMRDMTRYLASRNPAVGPERAQLRSLASYVIRSAIALPWSGR